MAFAGLTNDDDIANVIAYLKADPEALSNAGALQRRRRYVTPATGIQTSAPAEIDCFAGKKFNDS